MPLRSRPFSKPVLKDPKDFKILESRFHRNDVPLKVTGKAVSDRCRSAGMVYASVERCPVFGSKLLNYDDSAALKVKGVQQVVKSRTLLGKNKYEVLRDRR